MLIQENINLKTFNTFNVSAHARYFADIKTPEELLEALSFSQQGSLPFMIIGQGSNLLFKEDYLGLIIELNIKGIELINDDKEHYYIKAQCGENWHDFVQHCLQAGYYGLENLSLIPGTVGAAPVQNIGAYGVELSEFFHELEALEIASGKVIRYCKDDCQLSYRHSIFKGELKDKFVITNVTFKLLKKPKPNLSYPALRDALPNIETDNIDPQLISDTVCEIRRSKLPDPAELGNAGSFFWNPIVSEDDFFALQEKHPDIIAFSYMQQYKLAAAWLIDQAGWKGFREGDVGVHKEHALVLVNYGEATGAELYDLSRRIQLSVKKMFDIDLRPEVRII
ncbi:MAG: UDP-N-acetylmuramate dehydrogenase [Gammaproteobacteria bacterium]|jgi:UDP-N-acetylmuramate dehydrogenase|nr:UDP-N-acetylmuramate dehydrogenase [Gammaproteobacteria bacterium]